MRKFDEVYKNPTEGKECDNLVAIIGHLYNFGVMHPLIIIDILKLMIGTFTEKDVELILFLLRNVGFALRKDDPLALKELISEGQRKASDMGSKFQDQTRVGEITYQSHIIIILNVLGLENIIISVLDTYFFLCAYLVSGAFYAGDHAGFKEQ